MISIVACCRSQGRRQQGGQWGPIPHLKSVPPSSRLAHRLLHTSNTVFFKCGPSSGFRPPCCYILATSLAVVWSFAHMPLGISDRNKMVLWPGCGGRAEFSLHTKNVRSVWFVVKTRGCYCNLSGGVAFIVWFTTNGMCVKNNTIIYVARASNSKRDCDMVALPILTCEQLTVTTSARKERLRAWSLLLLAATVWSFAHMPLGISDRNNIQYKLEKYLCISCPHLAYHDTIAVGSLLVSHGI